MKKVNTGVGSAESRRALTPNEERRKADFDRIREALESEGYTAKDLTISLIFANVVAVAALIPLMIGSIALFVSLGYTEGWPQIYVFDLGSLGTGFAFLLLILFTLFLHEGIHGLTWALVAPNGMKSIRFGFMIQFLTPYCTCVDPLTRWQYVAGGLMPGLLLGLVPWIVAMGVGSAPLLVISIIMLVAAAGDVLIVLKLLSYPAGKKETVYVDHPTLGGLVVFER